MAFRPATGRMRSSAAITASNTVRLRNFWGLKCEEDPIQVSWPCEKSATCRVLSP